VWATGGRCGSHRDAARGAGVAFRKDSAKMAAVLFPASDEALYITDTELVVDGEFLAL